MKNLSIIISIIATFCYAINVKSGEENLNNIIQRSKISLRKFYIEPNPKISINFLSPDDDKLMNKLILDGHALVMESKPMESSDDSYCGCNCRCCFNL